MKTLYKNIMLVLLVAFAQWTIAQDMLNLNDINFDPTYYNTSLLAKDSSSLDISTIVSAANAVENNSKFHFLLSGSLGKYGLGIGAKVNTSLYNVYQTTTAELLLAKKIRMGKSNSLNFGINAGLILNNLRMDKINEYTNLEDPILNNETYDKTGFMAGLGLNYTWKDRLYLGFSMPVMVQSVEGFSPVYFTSLSYQQKIKSIAITPSFLAYGPDYTKPTFEGSLKLAFKDYAWLKVGGRSTKKVLFGAGGNVNFISFGYMYNMVLGNEFAQSYTGTHNMQVSFHFLAKKKSSKTIELEE
ncbi:MAG: type IX secretion system membrane protein PorP/SprF [Chitinophagales bacterium]